MKNRKRKIQRSQKQEIVKRSKICNNNTNGKDYHGTNLNVCNTSTSLQIDLIFHLVFMFLNYKTSCRSMQVCKSWHTELKKNKLANLMFCKIISKKGLFPKVQILCPDRILSKKPGQLDFHPTFRDN
jgi:hypothetical protein